MPTNHYAEDLAYIHDQGFDVLSRNAAPFLLGQLAKGRVTSGHIVSLGCGSGIAESLFAEAGFAVTGFDQSPEMLKLARRRCKALVLHNKSFIDAAIPECDAVAAFGEVFNYQFDKRANLPALRSLFRKIFKALRPGGCYATWRSPHEARSLRMASDIFLGRTGRSVCKSARIQPIRS